VRIVWAIHQRLNVLVVWNVVMNLECLAKNNSKTQPFSRNTVVERKESDLYRTIRILIFFLPLFHRSIQGRLLGKPAGLKCMDTTADKIDPIQIVSVWACVSPTLISPSLDI